MDALKRTETYLQKQQYEAETTHSSVMGDNFLLVQV